MSIVNQDVQAPARPAPRSGSHRALCLCCIGRAEDQPHPDGVGYESDQPLRAIDEGPLRAIVIDLDATYLAGPAAAERLEDMDWLVPRAERHEAIVAAAAGAGPVVPARFGCLFASEDGLRSMLASHELVLSTSLERVAGSAEHIVRLLMNRERAIDALLASEPGEAPDSVAATVAERGEPSEAGDSSLMLERRRRRLHRLRRDAGTRIGPWLTEALAPLVGRLDATATAACRHRITDREREGLEVVAHWAFLVPESEEADFAAALAEATPAFEALGVSVEASGPWPPYSFAPSVGSA